MEFLKNIQWYHYAIVGLIVVILFLIVMDCSCSKSSCRGAVRNEPFAESEGRVQADTKSGAELILYHASFCGYCKQMMPEWDKFADNAKSTFPKLKVSKYECDGADKAICDAANIQGFPTVVIKLPNGKVVTFDGERSAQGLANFVKRNAN